MRQDPSKQILARIYGSGRGNAFTPKDFLDLTSHETARQSLRRLADEGTIRRLMRGVYDYPAFSNLFNAPASPDPDAVARAIARSHGWTILPSGETALNLLGLSTQVPAQWEYYGDGPSKTYKWSGGTLAFKHRANKETTVLSPKTALVVQALKTLGKKRVDDSALDTLRAKLNEKERARAAREARYATSWVYEIIKRLAGTKERRHA
ncbi:MAG: hypothetical protein KGM47_08895 [Acidobacteriota bacterium]|nr:hypothetical protein [Acidobacteriota bacterium]